MTTALVPYRHQMYARLECLRLIPALRVVYPYALVLYWAWPRSFAWRVRS